MKSKVKGQKREAKIEKFTRVLLIWDLCDCLQKVEENGAGEKSVARKKFLLERLMKMSVRI